MHLLVKILSLTCRTYSPFTYSLDNPGWLWGAWLARKKANSYVVHRIPLTYAFYCSHEERLSIEKDIGL